MELLGRIRRGLLDRADPGRAAGQQAYMKSTMPFHGVTLPEVRKITRAAVQESEPLRDREQWAHVIRELWDGAERREERYAALALARHPRHRAFAEEITSLELYRHLILTGRWWDLCDETASLVGLVLAADRARVTVVLRDWSREDDLWLRRVAILSQLRHQEATDTDLLAYAIEGSIDDADFFARKGIGWALRQYARTDPDWVRAFVRDHPSLSRLSVREALKHLG